MNESLHFHEVATRISALAGGRDRFFVAIDGRCAAGKTTLATELERTLGAAIIHMDHFFLRPEQRTSERSRTPGENVDHERFLAEVLQPLTEGRPVTYRPYDCHVGAYGPSISVPARRITVIEGSYSCHPNLRSRYDLRLFVTVDPQEQMQRIMARNGEEQASRFRDRWIPLEELYLRECAVAGTCEFHIHT